MKKLFFTALIILMTFPALAKTSVERADLRTQLLQQLQSAQNEEQGRKAEGAIRRFWLKGPNMAVTVKLLTAIQARRHYDFKNAIKILDGVIAESPDYAEAYNQRAFLYFLLKKFDKSLEDIDSTLEREPKHFGALTGRAIIFLHQGRTKLARKALLQAVEIHPWLRERVFLSRIPSS